MMIPAQAQGKGMPGLFHRATLLPVRYGLNPERIQVRLRRMHAVLERWETTPTIPVTAIAIERHPEVLPVLRAADVAIHGYRHVDYTGLTRVEQAGDLDAALGTFHQKELDPKGFRAPYLRANADTMAVLASRQLQFDSSHPRFLLPRRDIAFPQAWGHVLRRYGSSSNGPSLASTGPGPLELPVALPDDEILVDAMGLRRPAALWRIFESMLEQVRIEGSLLALMVHPERFGFLSDAVELVLQRATDDGAWKASLSEISRWVIQRGGSSTTWPHGSAYAVAITGDLDALSLTDFAWRAIGR